MTPSWTILSPLPQDELDAIADDAEAALAQHGDDEEQVGELVRGVKLPDKQKLLAAYAKYGTPLPEDMLIRFEECESALEIKNPGDLDKGKLQVAMLRFLLDRIGRGFVLFSAFPLVETEDVIAELKKKKTVRGFGASVAKKKGGKKKIERRAEKPGELRAIRILRTLEAVEDNPDLAIDMRATFFTLPVLSQRYAAFLIDEGVTDDVTAAEKLGVPAGELAKAIETLDAALKSITS